MNESIEYLKNETIKPATPENILEMATILEENYHLFDSKDNGFDSSKVGDEFYFKNISNCFTNNRESFLYFDKQTQETQAFITIEHRDNCIGITKLFVAKKYQGLGIGRSLLDYLIKDKYRDCKLWVLHSVDYNHDAIKFYKKYGFKSSETTKRYEVVPGIFLGLIRFTLEK